MSDWEFLHGLSGQAIEDAMSTGATTAEWARIEAQQPAGATKGEEHRELNK